MSEHYSRADDREISSTAPRRRRDVTTAGTAGTSNIGPFGAQSLYIGPHGVIKGENRDLIVNDVMYGDTSHEDDSQKGDQPTGVALEILVGKLREQLAAEQENGRQLRDYITNVHNFLKMCGLHKK